MASQPEAREVEEHYVLRIKDPQLAEQVRAVLQGRSDLDAESSKVEVKFEDDDKRGKFVFNGQEYPLTVLTIPCVTETYKTFDDVNYVKVTDVGQVLLVGGDAQPESQGGEALDGITPPMRNVRSRAFRKQIDVDPELVSKVEFNLLTILAGGAPEGMKFVDYEEEYRINETTGLGEWVPVKR